MPGKTTRGKSSGQLSTINPNAAGIDIGSTFHVVAVPNDRDDQPVRTFRTFSSDLHLLADWQGRWHHDGRHGVDRCLLDSGL